MIRLKALGLDTYGVFEKTTLPLGKGLTLVVGPNEAGKSTALDALADLLWGVPSRHRLRDLTPRNALRISAEVDDLGVTGGLTDGATSLVVRTGRGLHRGEDVVQVIQNPWGSDGEDRRRHWLTAFGLSHQALREGGRQVFAGSGDLAELVFTAHQGQDVHDLLAAIERRADLLYKDHKNSKNVRVRVALEEFQRCRNSRDQALVRAAEVVSAEAEVADLKERSGEAAELEAQGQRQVTALAEHTRCLDTAHQILRVRQDIVTAQGEGALLGTDDLQAYDRACSDLQDAEGKQAQVADQLRTWTVERDALTVDDAVLADAEKIESLRTQAEARAADRERAAVEQSEAEEQDRLAGAQLEALLGRPVTVSDIGAVLSSLTVPADHAAQLDAAADRHPQLVLDRRNHTERVEQERADLESLGQGPELPDRETLAPLAADVGALRAADSPLVRLRGARDAEIAARRRRRQAMLEAAATDPEADPPVVPTEDDVLGAIERLNASRSEAELAAQRLREAESVLDSRQQARREAEAVDTVAPEDMDRARTERDSLWSIISRAWVERSNPVGGDPASLVADYGQRVQHADAVADRLLDQATFDARLAEAQRHLAEAHQRVEQRGEEHRQTVEGQTLEEAGWQSVWSDLGVAVPTTARAQVVRQAILAARSAAVDEATARETATLLEPEIVRWNAHLASLLAELGQEAAEREGHTPGADAEGLATLDHQLAVAEALIGEVDQAREQQERRRTAQQSLARAQARLERSEQELADWGAQWRAQVIVAGLPGTIDSAGWAARRDCVAEARRAHERADQLRRQASTAGQAWDQFAAAASELGARHGPAGTPERILDELWARLSTSRADQGIYRDRSESIAAATRHVGELSAIRDDARAVLDELCHRWALTRDEDLAQAADRGRRLTEATARQAELLAQLRTATDPLRDLEMLLADLAESDHARLQVRAAQAQEELQRAQSNRQTADQELGAAEEKLTHLLRRGDAAELNALAQEKLAEVSDLAEEYATLHLQRLVLREALETHAARHTSPLLDAAGRLLERLTRGRWVALRAEDDGAGTRSLQVIRCDGSPQPRTALSEGTADQVFLALRLAGIIHLQSERRRAGQTPVPVVLDDILMAFDEERARNALCVLADCAFDAAEPMQVILFTHHEHLASMAENLGRDDVQVARLRPRPVSVGQLDGDELRASAARASGALTAAARASGTSLGTAAPPVPRTPSPLLARPKAAIDPAKIRAWAKENGIEVADRGRLPTDVVSRYQDAVQG